MFLPTSSRSLLILLSSMLVALVRVEASFVRSMGWTGRPACARLPGQLVKAIDNDNQEEPPSTPNESVNAFLGSALGRAMRTMSTKSDVSVETSVSSIVETVETILEGVSPSIDSSQPETTETKDVQETLRTSSSTTLEGALDRAAQTLSTKNTMEATSSTSKNVNALLGSAMDRAMDTMSTKSDSSNATETLSTSESVNFLVEIAVERAMDALSTKSDSSNTTEPLSTSANVNVLLGSDIERAMGTLSAKSESSSDTEVSSTVRTILEDVSSSIDSSEPRATEKEDLQQVLRTPTSTLLQNAMDRASRTLSTKAGNVPNRLTGSTPQDGYLTNPAINPTALAHRMWSHILRPGEDTAIDATCGNGNDSAAIASMLFDSSADYLPSGGPQAQLICIDIQEEACDSTRNRLAEQLDDDTMEQHVQVLQTSHSPLPRPRDTSSVGLVCFNLGYLPNSDQNVLTQMETTLQSIADAVLLLRVGGMLSVTTYPRSNVNEDYAVHALLEGMALLTSNSVDWREFVDQLGLDPDGDAYTVRDAVRAALERIVAEGPPNQTWRVLENKQLGRSLSPILLTATRIK